MRTCTECKITKNESEFYKSKRARDGVAWDCKKCRKRRSIEYRRTKDGVVSQIYGSQRENSSRRNHQMPTYTKLELKDWLFSQKKFHVLYDNWKRLDYQKDYAPSIDRKKDSIGYTMDNVQLMTWAENFQKSHDDMRSGKLKHGHNPQKAVNQLAKNGVFIAEYVSGCEAERKTGICRQSISYCCNGKQKHAGGFKWEFTK